MNAATGFVQMPAPPYYAVIFSSQRTEGNHGYGEMAERMTGLAAHQPGFLGIDSVRGADGFGITVSDRASTEAISAWKADVDHLAAQTLGKCAGYAHHAARIARVERASAKPAP
ncbi:MAG: antibiotic biosynthesis monooxygenase [Pseudomonadota bacterium]|nr:antibiotic biosynthesis monooxygenase [Pseudomonadota bacterium]